MGFLSWGFWEPDLSIAKKSSECWLKHQFKTLLESAFLMAHIDHTTLVCVDGTSKSLSLQLCSIIAMMGTAYIEDLPTYSMLRLATFVARCFSGVWIARHWFQPRRNQQYATMEQSV